MTAARILVGLSVLLLCAGCSGKAQNQDNSQNAQPAAQSNPAGGSQSAANPSGSDTTAKQSPAPAQSSTDQSASAVPAHSPDQPMSIEGKKVVTTASGLKYVDFAVGTGTTAVSGKMVSVHYTGWLSTGKKFDSSLDRGEPIQFVLGAHRVIQGWDEGIAGMKIGGKRQLIIPPTLGYGQRDVGNGLIPPNSTLVFDVQLMGVQNAPSQQ